MSRVAAFIAALMTGAWNQPQSPASASRTMSCESTFRSDISAAGLAGRFGAASVTSARIDVGEGETEPGTVLFADSPEDRVEILWRDEASQRLPRRVQILGLKSRWRTPSGLTLGLDLRSIERLNRRPFRLLGFGWDYGGTTMSWSGGLLETPASTDCVAFAQLGPALMQEDASWRKRTEQVQGEREFSSGHPAMQALNPLVQGVSLEYRATIPPNH